MSPSKLGQPFFKDDTVRFNIWKNFHGVCFVWVIGSERLSCGHFQNLLFQRGNDFSYRSVRYNNMKEYNIPYAVTRIGIDFNS